VTTNAGSILTYTPAPDFFGTNTFDYRICDGDGLCDTGTVTVILTPVNDAPVASNAAISVPANTASSLTLPAGDPDGDVMTYVLLAAPTNGFATDLVATNGALTYTPVYAFSGGDSIGFTVHDGALTSAAAVVALTVTAPADGDSDGLPDAFEAQYGVSDPAGHDDGDGVPNIEEYFANTNPTNGASFLHLVGGVVTNGEGHLLITWDSIGGTRYRIAYGDGTAVGSYNGLYTDLLRTLAEEVDPAALGTPSTQSFTDDFLLIGGPPATGARYFQIKAVR
jgi:hypothetical protein